MSDYKEKLKTLMVNLEIQNVDDFIEKASVNDYAVLGREFTNEVKRQISQTKLF